MKLVLLNPNSKLFSEAIKDELDIHNEEFTSLNLGDTYLLMDNDKIVGQINYQEAIDSSDILYLYINKEYRGNGYSKVLLNESMNELYKKGIKEVFLDVRTKNTIARNLYKSVGFIEIGIRKEYYSDNDDAIVMKKILG